MSQPKSNKEHLDLLMNWKNVTHGFSEPSSAKDLFGAFYALAKMDFPTTAFNIYAVIDLLGMG